MNDNLTLLENNLFAEYAQIHKQITRYFNERPAIDFVPGVENFFDDQAQANQWDNYEFAELLYGYFQTGELLLTENPVQIDLMFYLAEIAPYEVANDYKLLRYINVHWEPDTVKALYEHTAQNMFCYADIRGTAMMDVRPTLATEAYTQIEPYAGNNSLKAAAHLWEVFRKSVQKKHTIELPLQ